jgi:hypothetical protein
MPRSTRKACDACSVRKVQCDGGQPCQRCIAYSFRCTFLKSRGKPGPKGPRKRTAEAIETLQSKVSSQNLQREENPAERWASPKEFSGAASLSFDNFHGQNISPSGSANWTYPYEGSSSLDPIQLSAHSKIHTSCIAHHLNKYEFQAYSIWPVFDTKSLINQMLADLEDIEVYGLSAALCAASITQFEATSATTPVTEDALVSPSIFEAESKRARLIYDHRERMTIMSLLTSFFLHVYAANIGKKSATTLLLSEAVTIAHVIGLHKRRYYGNLEDDQQQYCLRVYWLLFISERYIDPPHPKIPTLTPPRAHSFQHETPPALHHATGVPLLQHRPDGSISANFIHLCTLFNSLDEAVNANSREAIAAAQKQLNQRFLAVAGEDNEVQRADIFLTQQWMRVFLWQYSLSLTNLFSDHESGEFSLSFPAQVAKTALGIVSSLSRESLEAHGPGMVSGDVFLGMSRADVGAGNEVIRDYELACGCDDLCAVVHGWEPCGAWAERCYS